MRAPDDHRGRGGTNPALTRRRSKAERRSSSAVTVVAVLAGIGALSGCARRAPGPDECHDFATRLVQGRPRIVGSRRGIPIVITDPNVPEDDVLEATTECLTTPYDRELLACVDKGAPATLCFRAFAQRHSRTPSES